MRKYALLLALVVFATVPACADAVNGGTSVNINGTLYQDYFGGGSVPLSAIPGMNTATWDPATGLGTFIYTDQGTGARFFDVFINLDLGTVFWNENAAFNGSLAPGESAQADTPDFDCDANECGNIIANTNANALNDQNNVPGQLDNFLFDCGADGGGPVTSSCDNDVAMALGFNYNVPLGNEAVLSFTISGTPPTGGFYISQTKPQDGENDPETVYFSGDLAVQPVSQQPVPEPSTFMLVAIGTCILVLRCGKRSTEEVRAGC